MQTKYFFAFIKKGTGTPLRFLKKNSTDPNNICYLIQICNFQCFDAHTSLLSENSSYFK